MNEQNKNFLNNNAAIVSIVVGVVSTGIILLQMGNWVGRIETEHTHLTREVDKWDSQVIATNDRIAVLEHDAGVRNKE